MSFRRIFAGMVLSAVLVFAAADTRLIEAAAGGDSSAVEALLKQHVDVNSAQTDGTTALHWAALRGNEAMVRLLLSAGAKPNVANRYAVTPLSQACQNASGMTAELLIKAGGDPNLAAAEGETPLMSAAHSGNLPAATALIAAGADVNAREGFRGQTALMWAAATGHTDVVKLLVGHGADPTIHSAVRGDPPPGGGGGAPIAHGGMTALLFAARKGDLRSVKILSDAGANPNEQDADGLTPVILAIINTHYEVAAYLLERGADPRLADKNGRTPLYAAVDMHTRDASVMPNRREQDLLTSLDIINRLLILGVDVNVRLRRSVGQRAYLDGGDMALSAGTTPFIRSARGGDVTLMKLLVERGADPSLTLEDKTTALMIAAGTGYREGQTHGTEEEAIAAIQFCLDHGIDINAVNVKGENAVHGAAHRGADEIVSFLAAHGAKVDVKNKAGLTPAEIAIGKGQLTINPHETTAALLVRLSQTR